MKIEIPNPLLQAIVIPIVFVPIVFIIGRRIGKRVGWIACIPLAYTFFMLCLAVLKLQSGGSIYEEYRWAPITGLTFGLLVDGLNLPIILTISFLCILVGIYSIPYMEHRIYEEYKGPNNTAHAVYYALFLLYAVGMMGTVLATNLIQLYLFFELMLIPSAALINLYGYGEREKIALMYFVWTHVGAIFLLIGILTSYTIVGSFEIASLTKLIGNPMAIWIATAILLGFFVKMALVGVHIWLPYAHAEAPAPISALLSPAMIGIGAYASTRIVIIPLSSVFEGISVVLAIWALITMIYGGLMALAQDDIKRLLAYSSISQMGYLLLGLSSCTALGVTGAMFQYVSHATCKAILFLVAGILTYQLDTRSVKRLGGLASKMPITATVFLLGFLGIAGVPPLNGFQSEWLIFSGVFQKAVYGGTLWLLISVVAVITTLITVGYALWTVRRIFFGPLPDHLQNAKEAPLSMTAPLLILAIVSIVLGVYPRLITDFLVPTISKFIPP